MSDEASRPVEGSAAEGAQGSFGVWLRHQRESRSVSLREIADSSKISLRYLEALEQDRFDVLPAPVFARGFLREYARVVGLNPDEVVNLYLVASDEQKGSAPRIEAPRTARAKGAPSSVGYGLLLALAVLVFLGVAAFLSFYAERNRSPAPGAVASLRAPESADLESSGSATDEAETARIDSSPGDPRGPGDPGEPIAAASSTAGTAGRPSPEAPLRLVLTFQQDCWLESVVDGQRRTSELRAAGETVTLEGDESIVLTLGNASAALVELNGRPFSLPSNSSRVVRDFRIDRQSLGTASPTTATARP